MVQLLRAAMALESRNGAALQELAWMEDTVRAEQQLRGGGAETFADRWEIAKTSHCSFAGLCFSAGRLQKHFSTRVQRSVAKMAAISLHHLSMPPQRMNACTQQRMLRPQATGSLAVDTPHACSILEQIMWRNLH